MRSDTPITLDGTNLEEVDRFTYLGSVIDKEGGTTADIRVRIGKARAVFKQLKNIWKSGDIKTNTKI
jgi:hypothetical protein